MSGDPGRFDRWKVDLVGTFFGVLPEQENKAAIGRLEGEEDIDVVGTNVGGYIASTDLFIKEEEDVKVGEEVSLDDQENSFGKEESSTDLFIKEEDDIKVGEEASLDDLENSFGKEEFKIEVELNDIEKITSALGKPEQIKHIDDGQVTSVEALEEKVGEEESEDAVISEGWQVQNHEVIDLPKVENDTFTDRGHIAVETREEPGNSIKEDKVKFQVVMKKSRENVYDVEVLKVLPDQLDEAIAVLVKREDVENIMLVEESDESCLSEMEDSVKMESGGLVKIENVGNGVFCREADCVKIKCKKWKEVSEEKVDTNPDIKREVIEVAEVTDVSDEAVSDIKTRDDMEVNEVYEAATLPAKFEVIRHVDTIVDVEKNDPVSFKFQPYDVENSSEENEVLELCVQETESFENQPEDLKGAEDVTEQAANARVGIVEFDENDAVETYEENVRGKFQEVELVSMKSSCKVIDIEDSQESEDECEEGKAPTIVPRSQGTEAAESIIDMLLDAVTYEGPSKEVVDPDISHDDIATDLEIDLINEKYGSVAVPTPHVEDILKLNESEDVMTVKHADSATPIIAKIKAADNEVTAAPIDASKVAFACMDVRLKTGFPAKVVLKVKNCVSIILSGPENGEVMKKLGNLGCQAGLLKFFSQSRVMSNQVRKDLVFQNERDAVNFYKSIQANRSLKSFLLTESDLGFGSSPFLSESEFMYIMTNNVGEKNIMKMFDGRVEQDCEGKIQFKFSSLASLNLFLHHTGGAEETALGMLRSSMVEMKPLVLQGIYHRKRGEEEFKLDIGHTPARDKKPAWKFGWNWSLLEKTCNFKIESSRKAKTASISRKVLIFKSKFSLYEFWAGITAKLFREVRIVDLKLKEFVSSVRNLDRNIQFVEHEGEVGKSEGLERKQANLKVEDYGENADARLEEVGASCIEDNLTKKGEVGDVREGKSKKKKLNEGNKKEIQVDLMSDKAIQEEILARKVLENEMKTLKLETDKLKKDLKTALTQLEKLGTEVQDKHETIASLEERLVAERKAVINLENKLSHQEMEKKIQEEVARRTLENQINSLADYDCRQDDYYNDRRNVVLRNLAGNGRRSSQVPRPVSGPPQISWTNILSLTWRREEESGGNYSTCLWTFLRAIAGSLESVFKIEEEIILKFKSSEKLTKALLRYATEEGRYFTKMSDLKQRARLKPDELYGNYCLHVYYTEENFQLQSKKQLIENLRRAYGHVFCKEGGVMVTFPTAIAFVRALVSTKLWVYHRVILVRNQFELIGGNGENNFFKGKVCLTESNLLSLYFKEEDEAGFAESFSNFLKNKRIFSVDLGRNDRLVVTFNSLKELEECLKDYCQVNCNSLAKLIQLPVRCKLVVRNSSYSLLCPSTAVKKDFIDYQNLCRLEAEPRRISSKSKLCLVQILRDFDKQEKYPEIHFIEDNFYWKIRRGPPNPIVVDVNVLDDSQDNVVHGPPGGSREITSDYEESVYSEAAGGLDGRH